MNKTALLAKLKLNPRLAVRFHKNHLLTNHFRHIWTESFIK